MFRKKLLALAMAVCLSVTCGVFVNAQVLETSESDREICKLDLAGGENMVINPCWAYINGTITTLSISGSGVATGTSKITGYSGTTTKVHITMTLQKKGFLGLFWTDVSQWSQTFNNYYGTLSKTYNVSGGTYRVRAVYVAYRDSSSETITAYSSEVHY